MRPPHKAGDNRDPDDSAFRLPLASMRPPHKAGDNRAERLTAELTKLLQ